MSECALLDSFWGATGFFNIMMQRFYFAFAAALLHKVVLSMQNDEVHGVKKIPCSISIQHLDCKGVLNQHICIQPTVHVSSILSNYQLTRISDFNFCIYVCFLPRNIYVRICIF